VGAILKALGRSARRSGQRARKGENQQKDDDGWAVLHILDLLKEQKREIGKFI
jgi:hypothetical protein